MVLSAIQAPWRLIWNRQRKSSPLVLRNQWVGLFHHHDQLQPYSVKDSQDTALIAVAKETTHTKIIHEFGQGTRQ